MELVRTLFVLPCEVMLKYPVLLDVIEQDLGQPDVIVNRLLQLWIDPTTDNRFNRCYARRRLVIVMEKRDQLLAHELLLLAEDQEEGVELGPPA